MTIDGLRSTLSIRALPDPDNASRPLLAERGGGAAGPAAVLGVWRVPVLPPRPVHRMCR